MCNIDAARLVGRDRHLHRAIDPGWKERERDIDRIGEIFQSIDADRQLNRAVLDQG